MVPTSRAEQRQLKAEILRHDLKAVILDSEAKGETWTESTAWKNSRRLWNRMPRTGRSSLPLFIVYSEVTVTLSVCPLYFGAGCGKLTEETNREVTRWPPIP